MALERAATPRPTLLVTAAAAAPLAAGAERVAHFFCQHGGDALGQRDRNGTNG
jgi:hypothetical protein